MGKSKSMEAGKSTKLEAGSGTEVASRMMHFSRPKLEHLPNIIYPLVFRSRQY